MFKIAWNKQYAHPLPGGHRFPMEKYNLLPQQLLHEGTIDETSIFSPSEMDESLILLTHDTKYWYKLKNLALTKSEIRKTGFPLSAELVAREISIMQGTLDAAFYAFNDGIAFNIAGGTHHAYADSGEGFCLLNDLAIAANALLHQKKVKKVLIVDLDVHQGNGTAKIFQGNGSVFTFSMHGEKNYPSPKEKSDLDIPLADGTQDGEYLTILNKNLNYLFESVKPDFVFYQSGVDVLQSDKLGRLAMSISGCKERDYLVLEKCFKHQIPVACAMGGGYSEKIATIIDAHANTYRVAKEIYF